MPEHYLDDLKKRLLELNLAKITRIITPVQVPAPMGITMEHPFTTLGPEYASMLSSMVVTRGPEIEAVAQKLLRAPIMNQHIAVSKVTNIPALWYAAIFEREASSNFHLALGQGDPWAEVSTHVPKGQGPFKSWSDAAVFYTHYDHLDIPVQAWDMTYALFRGEGWNGFGPRNHGRFTGYLWSGTAFYDKPTGQGGKYVSDGEWSPTTYDQQLGIVPVIMRMNELRPDLAIPFVATTDIMHTDTPMHAQGIGGGTPDTKWIQHAINELGYSPPLVEDGNYGKQSQGAIRAFQSHNGLTIDGLAGADTLKVLVAAYNEETGSS